ncbi:MAG TPA: sulfurtransferase TusA family protein [Planctomycetota bacterium]|nr:sulfurtransferase TusA family protein [Planctomycetota bacterium]HRR80002.1 sulfurtransferase TusA family protein [Planctomycetota bacterium]HRT96156.1 sulfurtransferase TusA family protein [Planctomycetota bacterium]
MADNVVDARGLSCPEPVLLVKQAIESIPRGTVEVLVETTASRDNVTRMAKHLGCSVSAEEVGNEFRLMITKG